MLAILFLLIFLPAPAAEAEAPVHRDSIERFNDSMERGFFRAKAYPGVESRTLLPWTTQEDEVCFDFDTNRHGRPRVRVYLVEAGEPCR